MKKLFRSSLIIAAAALTLGLLSSCGGGGGGSNFSFQPDDNVNPAGVFPVCKEPVTLTLGIPQSPMVKDFPSNLLTNWFEKETNINFNFKYYPSANALQKIKIEIMSGAKLPDVYVGFGPADTDVFTFAKNKAIIPLNDYLDNYGYYTKQAYARNPALKAYMTMPDGNIYSMPNYSESTGNQWNMRVLINTAWLNKLGLSMPTTTDEFYNVLKAFKTGDPNGNGKADEIPLAGDTNGSRTRPYDFIFNAYIYNDGNQRYIVNDGKVDVAFTQPQWRDALIYMNKLYKEGLISPQSFTQTNAQFQQMVRNPDADLVGTIPTGALAIFEPDSPRRYDYEVMPPLTGPDGVCVTANAVPMPNHSFMITRDCKNPAAAFRWADLMMSEESALRSRYGNPGTTLFPPEPGDESMFYYTGYPAINRSYVKWNTSQNEHWNALGPQYMEAGISNGQVWNDDPLDNEYMISQQVRPYIGKAPPEVVSRLLFTDDEMNTITDLRVNINQYVNQAIVGFISGSMDINTGWDDYIKKLDDMQLDEYLKVSQDAYDRMEQTIAGADAAAVDENGVPEGWPSGGNGPIDWPLPGDPLTPWTGPGGYGN